MGKSGKLDTDRIHPATTIYYYYYYAVYYSAKLDTPGTFWVRFRQWMVETGDLKSTRAHRVNNRLIFENTVLW